MIFRFRAILSTTLTSIHYFASVIVPDLLPNYDPPRRLRVFRNRVVQAPFRDPSFVCFRSLVVRHSDVRGHGGNEIEEIGSQICPLVTLHPQ